MGAAWPSHLRSSVVITVHGAKFANVNPFGCPQEEAPAGLPAVAAAPESSSEEDDSDEEEPPVQFLPPDRIGLDDYHTWLLTQPAVVETPTSTAAYF